MTWGRRLTLGGLLVGGAALAYVELRALRSKEQGDTISACVAEAATAYPVTLGLATATLSHFATPTRNYNEPLPWWQGVWTALGIGMLFGLCWPRYDRKTL